MEFLTASRCIRYKHCPPRIMAAPDVFRVAARAVIDRDPRLSLSQPTAFSLFARVPSEPRAQGN